MRRSKIAKIRQKWQKESGRFDKDILLAHAIKKPKEFLYTNPEFRPSVFAHLRLAYFLFLYKRGYSVAAITGHKEFFGLDFLVNKNVLIPRPDTEILVESAIEIISNIKYPITIIDIGTGSGCIPISILKTLQHSNTTTLQHKNIETHAIDISGRALRVAKKNAKKHDVKIQFHQGDLLSPITGNNQLINQSTNKPINIVLTANLPYLTAKQFIEEKSIQKEPKLALIADDKNGLSLYEKLLNQIKHQFTCHPDENRDLCPITLFLEIDPSQTSSINELVRKIFSTDAIIKKDLRQQNRLAIINIPRQ